MGHEEVERFLIIPDPSPLHFKVLRNLHKMETVATSTQKEELGTAKCGNLGVGPFFRRKT